VCPPRLASSVVCLALLTVATVTSDNRTAIVSSINGAEIPADAQPRLAVEQQYGAVDRIRISLAGTRGVDYAHTVAPGDPITIFGRTHDGAATLIFRGEVIAVDVRPEAIGPLILIDGANASVRADQPLPRRILITRDASHGDARLVALAVSREFLEMLTDGILDIVVGAVIELEGTHVNFDGAYVVTGVQHRFGNDSYGGYSTALRVRLPELVEVEPGDLSTPVFSGSWWDCHPPLRLSEEFDHCRLLRWLR
jgi:hypothetical protein